MGKQKVTGSLFDAVKIALKCGGSVSETARFFKLSCDVVTMIRDAETLDEYVAAMYARSLKQKEHKQIAAIKAKEAAKKAELPKQEDKPEANTRTITIQASWQMTQEMRKTNELLEQISRKLAFIVDELTMPCKKVQENAEQDH